MQFNSIDFMFFFPVVIGMFFIIPRKCRIYWLLFASYYFYMSWNALYAILIGIATFVSYECAGIISKCRQNNKNRKSLVVLIISITINLGILFIFKYGNWIIESLNRILSSLSINVIERKKDFIVPVGISFYIFQSVGYMIDVYKEETKAEKNFLRYALFVSFFPQLVAGPIERSKTLLKQLQNIENIKLWNANRVTSGAIQMVWGFFMKMVIADRIAILVDTVFDNYISYGSTELIIAVIGFSIQIYCDFASYSMIAIGASKIMGIDLMENFDTPYFSSSVRDFWNRWHISLSTWFRDYLYITLGGNKKGTIKKYINIMIVFLLSGLWHGPEWSFVLWGGLHGFYLILGECSKPIKEKLIYYLTIKTDCFSWKLLKILITFSLVSFAWIFFRASSVSDALGYIQCMISRPSPWTIFDGSLYNLGLDVFEANILFFSLAILFFFDFVKMKEKKTIDQFLLSQNVWFEWGIIILLIVMIFIFGEYGPSFDAKQFIYFQF